jgi:ACR3 family arsenite transporter
MTASILKGLGWLDRFLAVFVLLAMILGVIIGTHWAFKHIT